MPIFQKSVVNKYLKMLDDTVVNQAYTKYNEYFKDHIRLFNIMQLKEENYQEGFLRELFVDVLGYTINPNKSYNLTTEFKNLTDNKKADGAIIKDNKAIGVIELKSTKTLFIEKITNQAFNYKNNHPTCRYVITSTFRFLRLYIDSSNEFEEFDLFNMPEDDFKRMYLFLCKENIFNDITLRLKEETKFHEENISDRFYKDYKQFKEKIFENIVKNNSQHDKLILLKKTQKLLDRILFIAFAEDKGLIPPNALSRTIEKWKMYINEGDAVSLYSRFQLFFQHLNNGFTYKDWGVVPAYNGGLFAIDDILDNKNLIIDDEILKNGVRNIAKYDFNTEIDVNILGHIFEHSLNEIDEISASNLGQIIDLKKTKRKKDGVFYTPDYITKYIVNNTIGEFCKEKKHELQIYDILIDDTHHKNSKITKKGREVFEKIQTYKNWLFEIKILDPACGSGAFLIQALDFLIQEHKETDELMYQLTGESIKYFDTDKTILENNIYGVDINEESIEIAKLSLWLHTAKKERKLSDLSNNLKCGNSLIDNEEYAGEKAFNWKKQFPQIMQAGGFDIVIGNPPYINIQQLKEKERFYLLNTYPTCKGRTDIYVAFIDFSAACFLKNDGYFSFIIPYSYINQNYAEFSRKLLTQNATIKSITDFSNFFVFPDAVVKNIVLTVKKNENYSVTEIRKINSPAEINHYKQFTIEQKLFLHNKACRFETRDIYTLGDLQDKIDNQSVQLDTICFVAYGARLNQKKTKNGKEIYIHQEYKEGYKPFLEGKNIERYRYSQHGWLNYKPEEHYNPMFPELFENEKIILIRIIKDKIRFAYDTNNFYNSHTVINCVKYDKLINVKHVSVINRIKHVNIEQVKNYNLIYLLTILNSNLMNWYFANFLSDNLNFYPDDVKRLPIPVLSAEQQKPFIELGNTIISYYKQLDIKTEQFSNYLKSRFDKITFSKKLENWYNLNNVEFLLELKKNKISLKTKDEADLLSYFQELKQETTSLISNIEKKNSEIDNLVYKIYNLTNEEIEIVSK